MPWKKINQSSGGGGGVVFMEYEDTLPAYGTLKVTAPKPLYTLYAEIPDPNYMMFAYIVASDFALGGFSMMDDSISFLKDGRDATPIIEDNGRTATITSQIEEDVTVTIRIVCKDAGSVIGGPPKEM